MAKFKIGDHVRVFNARFNGDAYFEGNAVIVGPGEVTDQYEVKFYHPVCLGDDDKTTHKRFVHFAKGVPLPVQLQKLVDQEKKAA